MWVRIAVQLCFLSFFPRRIKFYQRSSKSHATLSGRSFISDTSCRHVVIDFLFLFFRSVFVCGQNFVRGGHSYKNVMVIRLDHNTNRDIAATDVIETIGLLTYDDAHH